MKYSSVLLIWVLVPYHAFSQEWLGIINSNYGGNVSVQLNPAAVVGSPFTREINLIAADFSAHNNYLYYEKKSHALNRLISGKSTTKISNDHYTASPLKQAYYSLYIKGPGIMYSGIASGLAFNTSYRHIMAVNDLSTHFAKFILEGFDYQPQHQINFVTNPFKFNFISLYDFSATYGRGILNNKNNYISAGLTMSIYSGTSAFFADFSEFDYNVPVTETLIVTEANMRYGYAFTGGKPRTKDFLKPRGWGTGGSAGLLYINHREEKAYHSDNALQKKYRFKIGLSLTDAGFVRFKKEAKHFLFQNESTVWNGIDTVKFGYMEHNDSLLGTQFTGSAGGAYEGESFTMFLPASINLQLDIAIAPTVYFNFTAIQHRQLYIHQVQRNDQLAASIRYEKKNWEITMPVSLYNYYQTRVGLGLRYRWFYIGSDRAGVFTGQWDLEGIDLFFGLRLYSSNLQKRKVKLNDCFLF